jgi:hypothetical protein
MGLTAGYGPPAAPWMEFAGELTLSTPCCRRRPAAIGNPNKSARYRRFARFFELLPVRRVLERLFRLALLLEHVAPRFQRIGPVRSALVRVLELHLGFREIAVAGERDAPREVRAWQIRGECYRLLSHP